MPKLTRKQRRVYLKAKLIFLIIRDALYIIAYGLGNLAINRMSYCRRCGDQLRVPAPKDLRYCRDCYRKFREDDKRREQLFGGRQGLDSAQRRYPVRDKPDGKNGYHPDQ